MKTGSAVATMVGGEPVGVELVTVVVVAGGNVESIIVMGVGDSVSVSGQATVARPAKAAATINTENFISPIMWQRNKFVESYWILTTNIRPI